MAGDLRFVASSFKILTDLERVGDLATNLAGYALDAARVPMYRMSTSGYRSRAEIGRAHV